MAVYRSDQAQVTFGSEAGHGGYTEAATGVTIATSGDAGAGALDLAAGFAAGSTQIIVDGVSGTPTDEFQAGDYIQIGTVGTPTETEVRRCDYISQDDPASGHCTITLDSPLGFFHADNEAVTIVTAVDANDEDKFITWVPGVYETVDVPDPEMAIEGRYLLGTNQKRNFFVAYKGQQTLSGSIGGFVLLNGWPLRYSIGKVSSVQVGGTHTSRSYLAESARKGDYWVKTTDATSVAAGDVISIDGYQFDASGNAAGDVVTSPLNRGEIRRVVEVSSSDLRLNYPLSHDHFAGTTSGSEAQVGLVNNASNIAADATAMAVDNFGASKLSEVFAVGDFLKIDAEVVRVEAVIDATSTLTIIRDQAGTSPTEVFEDNDEIFRAPPIYVLTGTATYYQHDIYESVELDTVSWHVHLRDSAETLNKDFNRRYFGGHVGSTTISADEGGLLTASWDSVTFRDMVHNQKEHSGYNSGNTDLPGYTIMQSIAAQDVGVPLKSGTYADTNIDTLSAGGFPSTDPYYFSQGSLSLFGVEFARVRSFNISINNGEEARYYIGGQGKGTRRHRGPSEIREMQREYSMSATIALPDSHIGDGVPTGTVDSSKRLFTELILEGDYGTTSSSMTGFDVVLTFTRGTNDTITFTVPGSSGGGSSGSSAAGGGKQGAFIRSAPHTITGDNPFQVDVDIMFRNMDIRIRDTEPYYP